MESTEPDASAPMGLWEFARHIRTTTATGTTTVRLVVPTDLTERGASDLMGLRSSAGHISCNNPRGSGENEPQRIIDSIVRVLAIRRPVSSGDFAQACGSARHCVSKLTAIVLPPLRRAPLPTKGVRSRFDKRNSQTCGSAAST